MGNDTHEQSESPEGGVSLVITCFNQGAYLPDAIESVLRQSVPPVEIVLVDDGSTDATREIAERYERVRYLHQPNQGLASARNRGILETTGPYLVFLDADDLLCPTAIEHNLTRLGAHAECAFVYGASVLVGPDGSFLRHPERFHPSPDGDPYASLLLRNIVGMHGAVMYRREALESVRGFDVSLAACEDYELYLRIARDHPILGHRTIVAQYRRHTAAMSTDAARMLRAVQAVLRSQQAYVEERPQYREPYESGWKAWTSFYGRKLFFQTLRALSKGRLAEACRDSQVLAQHVGLTTALRELPAWVDELLTKQKRGLRSLLPARSGGRPSVGRVRFGDLRRIEPIGDHPLYGATTTVSGYYIDRFLSEHIGDLGGRVLGIGDYSFTRQIPGDDVVRSSDYRPDSAGRWRFDAWVEERADAPEPFDSIVILHRLHRVYDPSVALTELRRILRKGGILLATVPGVSAAGPYSRSAETYWQFTPLSARRLFESVFPSSRVRAEAYGNAQAAIAQLHRLDVTELSSKASSYRDGMYPVLVGIKAENLPDEGDTREGHV